MLPVDNEDSDWAGNLSADLDLFSVALLHMVVFPLFLWGRQFLLFFELLAHLKSGLL